MYQHVPVLCARLEDRYLYRLLGVRFFLIQFALKMGFMWQSVIELIVTVLMLPMLYFARTAVSLSFCVWSKGRQHTLIRFFWIIRVQPRARLNDHLYCLPGPSIVARYRLFLPKRSSRPTTGTHGSSWVNHNFLLSMGRLTMMVHV